jgi:hypothetical protein
LVLCVPLGHESLENLIGSRLARDDIGVLAGVVNLSNIIKLNKAILVHVELVVGSHDPLSSGSIQVTLYSVKLQKIAVTYLEESEEFIETNGTVSILIEFSADFLGFFFAQLESVVDESPSEIINI